MRYDNILQTIGNTPAIRLNRLFRELSPTIEVWIKLERSNPGGSLKDRIALRMVEEAEASGALKPGGTIVEPTSGNTGVGLALVAAVKGYRCILVLSDSMSVERRRIMASYGAEIELTPAAGGIKASIARAEEIVASTPGAWMPQQFENQANVRAHAETTAQEIIRDFPDGLDVLITGVGTGGHLTGVSEILKQKWTGFRTFAVEPVKSPVISGGQHQSHKLQGIGTGMIPRILNLQTINGAIVVNEEEAYDYARRAAREEGIFAGISTGAALAAVAQKLPALPPNSKVLTFNYDTGERYLSVDGLFPIP